MTGRHDDFFSLGGDSILAVQLAARARDTGLRLTARMVFEQPTLHELAAAIELEAAVGATSAAGADTSFAPMSVSGLSAEELAGLTASWNTAGEGDR